MNLPALLAQCGTRGARRLATARRVALLVFFCASVAGCGAAHVVPGNEPASTAAPTAAPAFNADQQIHEQDYCSCNK